MKTPKAWSDNLKNGIITEEMFDAALYSVNKRAKNCRDKKREYNRIRYDSYHNAEKYESQEHGYYRQKEKLLSFTSPVCIHREHQGFERRRHYDYEKGFDGKLIRALTRGLICWSNYYVKREYNYYDEWEEDCDTETVWFFDELLPERPVLKYYLFYRIGEHSYHSPITEEKAKELQGKYPIRDIGLIQTEGHEITELCSTSFVGKVIDALEQGTAKLELSAREETEECENVSVDLSDSMISYNIETACEAWGDYLLDLIQEKVEIESISDRPLDKIANEYLTNLAVREKQKAKEIKRRIQKIRKLIIELSDVPNNSREKELWKLKNRVKTGEKILNHIPLTIYWQEPNFWDWFFKSKNNSSERPYQPSAIDSLEDLKAAYQKFRTNQVTRQEYEDLITKCYDENENRLYDQYIAPLREEWEFLKRAVAEKGLL